MGYAIPEPEQAGHSVLAATFEYNAWANLKLLDYCDELSDEQLGCSAVGGYGTIRDTLKHMVYAEVDYVTRVNGKEPADPPPWKEFPGFDVLRASVRWANEELLRLARGVEVRYYLVGPHYRSSIEYSDTAVQESAAAYRRIESFVHRVRERVGTPGIGELRPDFVAAMDDDLGTPADLEESARLVREQGRPLPLQEKQRPYLGLRQRLLQPKASATKSCFRTRWITSRSPRSKRAYAERPHPSC